MRQGFRLPVDTRLLILAPVVRGRKGEFQKLFEQLKKQGFVRVIVDGEQRTLDEDIKLVKTTNTTFPWWWTDLLSKRT